MNEHSIDDDRDLRWAWGVGLVAALLVVGPGLMPGSWLNLDLVVTPVTPVPRGAWGLGPELPRRVPFALPFAWISSVWPSEVPWKLAVVAALASCAAGTWRLVRLWGSDTSRLMRAAAALIVAVGPFGATRLGAGHLGMTFALALLPWAMPRLLRPLDEPSATVGWALALGLAGPFGGTVVMVPLVVGLVLSVAESWHAGAEELDRMDRRRLDWPGLPVIASAGAVAAGSVIAQLPWLVPTLVVAGQGTDVAGGSAFPTDLSGPGGPLRALAGHGFWRPLSQVGGEQGWEVAAAGGLILLGAVAGVAGLPGRYRRPVVVAAVFGLLGGVASGIAGLDVLADRVTDLPGGAALREGQRLLAVWVVLAVPAAAVGAERSAARAGAAAGVVTAVPLALAVLLVGPGLWGIGGALHPVELPSGWAEVRERVTAEPGTVLALPWRAYPQPSVVGGRSVSQPLAVFLGGDVLTSSDARLGDGTSERADPRERRADELVLQMSEGRAVSGDLRDLGIRWLVDIDVIDDRTERVPADGGLRSVYADGDIALYEVVGWRAAWRADDGTPVAVSRPVPPVIRVEDGAASGSVVVASPDSAQWRPRQDPPIQGGGLLVLPAGAQQSRASGALATLAADFMVLVLGLFLLVVRLRGRTGTESS